MTTPYSDAQRSEKEKSGHSGPLPHATETPAEATSQEPDTLFPCGCSEIPASMEYVQCGCVETDVNAYHKEWNEREIQLNREKRIEELEQIIHEEIQGEDE